MDNLSKSMIRQQMGSDDAIRFVWIVDKYFNFNEGKHTYVGGLIKKLKYSSSTVGQTELSQMLIVIQHSIRQIVQQDKNVRGFDRIDEVMAVPCFKYGENWLPNRIAGQVSVELNRPDTSSRLRKVAETPKAKIDPKFTPDAYEIEGDLTGRSILLVDDVFGTGNTLRSVAINLKNAGAESVTGFCLAKTTTGISNGI